MKRLLIAAALLGTLTFWAASPAEAFPYRRPIARATARVALPPYRIVRPPLPPRYYYARPAPYFYGARGFYGPGSYGYSPGFYGYGPGVYVGIGAF